MVFVVLLEISAETVQASPPGSDDGVRCELQMPHMSRSRKDLASAVASGEDLVIVVVVVVVAPVHIVHHSAEAVPAKELHWGSTVRLELVVHNEDHLSASDSSHEDRTVWVQPVHLDLGRESNHQELGHYHTEARGPGSLGDLDLRLEEKDPGRESRVAEVGEPLTAVLASRCMSEQLEASEFHEVFGYCPASENRHYLCLVSWSCRP